MKGTLVKHMMMLIVVLAGARAVARMRTTTAAAGERIKARPTIADIADIGS